MKSPKEEFRGELVFKTSKKGVGSVVSMTGSSIESVENKLSHYEESDAHVTIMQNKKKYPEFEWVTVKSYNIK